MGQISNAEREFCGRGSKIRMCRKSSGDSICGDELQGGREAEDQLRSVAARVVTLNLAKDQLRCSESRLAGIMCSPVWPAKTGSFLAVKTASQNRWPSDRRKWATASYCGPIPNPRGCGITKSGA